MTGMAAPNPVVVVPVHRPQPNPEEQISLRRCGEVLTSHPIRIVHPAGMDLEAYGSLLPSAIPMPVPSAWMASIRSYNRMMLNPAFYSKLAGFSHLLIHEPDALVLSDQLLEWCREPYDYIGAPWFEGYENASPDGKILGVGNSGFSLMRIAAVNRAFTSTYRWLPRRRILRILLQDIKNRRLPDSTIDLVGLLATGGQLRHAHVVLSENFDIFLCSCFPRADLDFAIAPVEIALSFSWEANPRVCMQLTKGKLPFGVHAWGRYDPSFIQDLTRP